MQITKFLKLNKLEEAQNVFNQNILSNDPHKE